MSKWQFEDGVRCVVCPGCAFTFDAGHEDVPGGGYSCPSCGYGDNTDHTAEAIEASERESAGYAWASDNERAAFEVGYRRAWIEKAKANR